MKQITANVLIDPETWEKFKIINIKCQERTGEALGKLVTAEVKKNAKLLKGE